MPVVSMINRKTGVGKTTLTIALADFLSAIHGRSVLIIDMDPQATASLLLLGEGAWSELEINRLTVADLFEHAIQPSDRVEMRVPRLLVQPAWRVQGASGTVNVIASSPRLHEIEDGALDTLARRSPYAESPYALFLQSSLATLINEYDHVLIDCPPSLAMITLNALTLSSGYLIPTHLELIARLDLMQLTRRVTQHADGLRRTIPLYGTVVTRVKETMFTRMETQFAFAFHSEALPLWDTTIPETERVDEVLNQGQGLMSMKARYGGKSHALYSSFEALANEFLQRVS